MATHNKNHGKGGGFFDKPLFRSLAAVSTLGASELARAGVKAARGEKVNVGRALAAAATLGGSELAYGAGIIKDKSGKPIPDPRAIAHKAQAAAAAAGRSHLAPPPGKLYPQRKHVGRSVVGMVHPGGPNPAPNHPRPGHPFPERKVAGRRVVNFPEANV